MNGTDVREWVSQQGAEPVGTLVGTALGALLVETVGTWALTAVVGVGVRPRALLIVLATVSLGVSTRWGLAVGMLLAGLLVGGWTGGVISAIAVFITVVVCGHMWAAPRKEAGSLRWLSEYAFVALVATLTLAGTSAWLMDAFGTAAFSVVVGQSIVANLPLALLGAPVAWLVADFGPRGDERGQSKASSTRERLLVVVTLSVWVVGGYVGSFLYRAAGTVPADTFGRRLGDAAATVVRLGGPQGQYPVFILGVVVLVTLFAVFRYGQSHA